VICLTETAQAQPVKGQKQVVKEEIVKAHLQENTQEMAEVKVKAAAQERVGAINELY